MRSIPVYFKDGTLFANDYVRVVHGARGSYMELDRDQITMQLVPHFKQELPMQLPTNEGFYYYWLKPLGREEKVYWQNRTVKYADYRVGMFYVDVSLVEYESKNSLLC